MLICLFLPFLLSFRSASNPGFLMNQPGVDGSSGQLQGYGQEYRRIGSNEGNGAAANKRQRMANNQSPHGSSTPLSNERIWGSMGASGQNMGYTWAQNPGVANAAASGMVVLGQGNGGMETSPLGMGMDSSATPNADFFTQYQRQMQEFYKTGAAAAAAAAAREKVRRNEGHKMMANLEAGARERTEMWLDSLDDEFTPVKEMDLSVPTRYVDENAKLEVFYDAKFWLEKPLLAAPLVGPLMSDDQESDKEMEVEVRRQQPRKGMKKASSAGMAYGQGRTDDTKDDGDKLQSHHRMTGKEKESKGRGKPKKRSSNSQSFWEHSVTSTQLGGPVSREQPLTGTKRKKMVKSLTDMNMLGVEEIRGENSQTAQNMAKQLEESNARRKRRRRSNALQKQVSMRSVAEVGSDVEGKTRLANLSRSWSGMVGVPSLSILCLRAIAVNVDSWAIDNAEFKAWLPKLPPQLLQRVFASSFGHHPMGMEVLEVFLPHLASLRILSTTRMHLDVDNDLVQLAVQKGHKLQQIRFVGGSLSKFQTAAVTKQSTSSSSSSSLDKEAADYPLKLLSMLELNGCPQLKDISLQGCSKLAKLMIARCVNVDEDCVNRIVNEQCTHLEEIVLSGGNWLKQFHVFNNQRNLRKLDLSSQVQLTQVVITDCPLEQLFVQDCVNLTKLSVKNKQYLQLLKLNHCAKLSSETIRQLLTGAGRLRILEAGSCVAGVDREMMVTLANNCPKLKRLMLPNCVHLDDEGMIEVALRCRELVLLMLNGCTQISESAIYQISQSCMSLKSLHIGNCRQIDGASLIQVGNNCSNLADLDLQGMPQLTDTEVEQLVKGCGSHLYKLNLKHSGGVGHKTVIALGMYASESLRMLNVGNCNKLNDNCVKALSNCTALQAIDFSGCMSITDEGMLRFLQRCTQLQSISLFKCSLVTDASIHQLRQYNDNSRLRSLDLASCENVSDESLVELVKVCPGLQDLDLETCQVSNVTVEALGKYCHELKALKLAWCKNVNASAILGLSKQCKKLVALDLSWTRCVDLGSTDMQSALRNFTQLRVLNLTGVSHIALAEVEHPALNEINLSWCKAVNADMLDRLTLKCPSLQTVDLSWCGDVDDEAVLTVTENLLFLKVLNIKGCFNVSKQLVDKLRADGSKVKFLMNA
eukprot:TRINITY_DN395_c1_g3_i1.p1 TRINITY_DN395_c1_g3~~TRINITY_DN395_c1_g3_i1.p1  ORF type:complete len:1152 (+),score=313.68 TRINITY_DN395_c1_g3_i1:317-3772(+)